MAGDEDGEHVLAHGAGDGAGSAGAAGAARKLAVGDDFAERHLAQGLEHAALEFGQMGEIDARRERFTLAGEVLAKLARGADARRLFDLDLRSVAALEALFE